MSVPPVQTAIAASNTSTSGTGSFTSAVTSGNCVVGILSYGDGGTITSITDDKSNTYTVLDTIDDTTNGQKCSTFILGNITNGPKTLTANFSGSISSFGMVMGEYSGISAVSNPNDGHTGQLQASTAAPSSGNITTTVSGDTIVGLTGFTSNFGPVTLTAGSGYTKEASMNGASAIVVGLEDKVQSTSGSIFADWTTTSGAWISFIVALKPTGGAAALSSFGWYRREFEGAPPKAFLPETRPTSPISKILPTPSPIIWREHDNVPFAKGRDDPGARGSSLTIPVSHPIIPWREHDNVPFAKGRDDPGARGTSLTIPLAAPIIPRTSQDLNPYAQGRDEPARWRIQSLPTPSPVLLAPHDFNPFPQGRSECPAIGTALTIPTVPPVYNAPQNFNPFALGRSEPPAMGLPKLLITTLAPLVFWREHDNTPYAQGRSEPSSRVFQLAIPIVPPVYNAPHDFNQFALGRSEPPAIGWKSLPTPSPALLAPHDFNPFAQGKSDPPAIGWPKLLIAVLAPIVFNAPAIHTAFVQGTSEPVANGWMILQQPVVVVTEHHDLPFFATPGSLMTR